MKHNNILQAIGSTPLVRINRLFSQYPVEVWAKCEFMNPGGSVKDRIALRMIIDAQNAGRIKPGDTLIEATSGNTGIGLALAGAVLGYKVIITMPEKMSSEKQVVLEALGALIVRTPNDAPSHSPESHIGIAKTLEKKLPNAHILDQYNNASNPNAHSETTAREIIEDLSAVPDAVVMATGTCGTLTGIAREMKKHSPKTRIVGVDPAGSIISGEGELKFYHVEGIGYDFVPSILARELVDEWVKTEDASSFLFARRAICEEGLLCGGSSGASLSAVEAIAKTSKPGSKIVVILADGVRNYLSKFLSADWLKTHGLTAALPDKQVAHATELRAQVQNALK